MTSVKAKAQAAAIAAHEPTAWGHTFGVAGFIVISFFIPTWPEAFEMPKVLVLTAMGFAALPLLWTRRDALWRQRVPVLLLAAFVGFALLSQLLSGAPQLISLWGDWSRRAGTLTVLVLSLILCAGIVLTRTEIRVLLAWLVWAGVPAVAYGLIQAVGADPIPWNNQGWIVSTFGNPNYAAAGLSMLALLTAGLALTRSVSTVWRALMAPLAALEAALALQTGSSLALFALAAGIGAGAVVCLLRWTNAGRLPALLALAAVGASGFVLTLMGLLGSGPLERFISSDTLMFRQWYWGAALGMSGSHPFLGVGPDGFGRFYGEFRSEEAAEMVAVGASAAHNVPLQWAATLGIPAAILYVTFMVAVGLFIIHRLWVQRSSASPLAMPLLAVWAAYQVQSLVSIDAIPIAMLGWLSTGLLLAVTAQELSEPKTRTRGWIAAGTLALIGLGAWLPAMIASNASKAVTLGSTDQDVFRAISLVESTTLPCDPSVRVGLWMIRVAPAKQTVDAVYAGAEADDRCYGLINAAADFALQLEEVERALFFAEQGVKIDPLNYQQWILLAKAQHATGDDLAAANSLETAIGLSPAAQSEVDQLIVDLGLPPLS